MIERNRRMTPEAIALLIAILESPELVISASAASKMHPAEFSTLCADHILISDGDDVTMASVTDDEGCPIAPMWDTEREAYGYFDPTAGWTGVSNDDLRRCRIDMPKFLTQLLAECRAPGSGSIVEIIPGLVWDAGRIRLPGREKFMPVWFARRLFDTETWRKIRLTARNRPPETSRIVLTSTPADCFAGDPIARHVLVGFTDVLAQRKMLRIDPRHLTLRLDGGDPTEMSPVLEVIGDGHLVRLRGAEFRFQKGDQQRRILVFLYQKYLGGESRVSVAEIVAELGFGAKTRIRDVFKGHAAWGKLLTESGGTCGFCLNGDWGQTE